jgi:sugar transferase (PEP-CTERM/EpsH1 system associated)
MNILFVSPRQCWPVLSGAKLRDYHLARALSRRAALTYVYFSEPELPQPAPADLPFCEQLIPVRPPRRYSAGHVVRGLFGRWPLPIENYRSAPMTAAIEAQIQRRRFDLVHFDGVHLAAYVAHLRDVASSLRVAVDWHNIESEGMRRYAELARSLPKRLYAAITSYRLAGTERMLLSRAFGNLVCSERERRQLLPIAPPGARIAVMENGVDTAYYADPPDTPERPRERILFVGAMDYHPNIDAMLWFTERIWPALRGSFPDWRLTIVGSRPGPSIQSLNRLPGVEVTGTVPDVRPYYREAFAAIVPLRTGMGTRLKILEAMAAGVPVVSTALGAEGLAVTPGADLLLADREDDWCSALQSLTAGPFRDSVVRAGLALTRSRYDWGVLGETVSRTYHEWMCQ